MHTIAALYVDPRGPYPKMLGIEPWDEVRDARGYAGPWPIIAHPPCGPWGRLRHMCHGRGKDLGPIAVEQVRKWGGVLEHPAWSKLWEHCDLPKPGEAPDEFGGYTVLVNQVDFGHVARKATWLYLVGVPRVALLTPPRKEPTHWVSGTRAYGMRGTCPPHVKICSAAQRRRTPEPFRGLPRVLGC